MQPGHQFVELERLEQVVVGAGPQAFDTVFERVARRQHQHRDRLPLGAPAREQRHAVFVGQAEVEHTDIEVRRGQRRTRLRGGVDVIHRHTQQAQPGDDAAGDQAVVFDQQDVHGGLRRAMVRFCLGPACEEGVATSLEGC